MKRDKNKLIGTKHILSFARKGILLFFLTCLAFFASLNGQTPKIWPTEISFNYEGGSSNDAITIKKNASSTISAPEYIRSESSVTKNENCAYIKSQGNRKIKVKFNSNNSNMNYLIKATVIFGTGLGNICEIFVAPCDLNSKVFTIELPVSVPSSVGKRTFTWKWEATALPINSPYCPITCTAVNTEHTYYTLLSPPQSPVVEPWTDVLDLTCIWASGKTTESQVVAEITQDAYAYFDQVKYYNGGGTHAAGTVFNLTLFLSQGWGDCRDMSAVVQVFTWMMGGSTTRVRQINSTSPYSENFSYKAIDPFGSVQSWHTGTWNFHQIGWYNNVYDACMRIKQSDPRIAVNEDVNGTYKTDLFSSGSWEPKTPFYYTTVY